MEKGIFLGFVVIAYLAVVSIQAQGCGDSSQYMSVCGAYRNRGYCKKGYVDFMKMYCKKTCGLCVTPVNGGYSRWLPWSPCSRTCGGGAQSSKRICNNPAPRNGGAKCSGLPYRTRTCNKRSCAVKLSRKKCANNPKYISACKSWAPYCDSTSKWYGFMKDNCKITCGLCKGGKKVKKVKKTRKVNKCAKKNGGCQQICAFKYNKAVCSCKAGYIIDPDFKSCTKESGPQPSTKAQTCGKEKTFITIGRVVGGVDAFPYRWNWQGGMYYFEDFTCGGALITKNLFLTAAHCVSSRGVEGMVIRMGDHKRDENEGPEQELKVEKIEVHKGWNWFTLQDDIALLKLKGEYKLNENVGVVCLPKQNAVSATKTNCYITGWGKTSATEPPANILQEAKLPIISNKVCGKRNVDKEGKSRIVASMLCAGFQDVDSTVSGCRGDSGGPYVCKRGDKWELQGVVSWGSARCEVSHRFTVFTRVSKYIKWIDTTSKKLNN